jgi:predicted metal-dependent hydrolase
MSTKQLRLSDAVQIRKRVAEFLGKKINIVLTDNTAMFGELTDVNATEIKLLNMRRKKMTYRIDTIAELYFDTLA